MAHTDPVEGAPSRAAIAGHPIHPMLVPFPVAFLPGAFVTDIVYHATDDLFWARASFWLIAAGIVMGLLAAVFGLIDFLGIRRVRDLSIAWVHFLGNLLAVLISLFNLFIRWGDPAAPVWPTGFILSLIVTAILVVTGWAGGEMSYRYRIGVLDYPDRRSP